MLFRSMLERRLGNYGNWRNDVFLSSDINSYTDSSAIVPDSNVSYRLRAYANSTYSEYSSVVSIAISLPSPTNLRLASNSEYAISI